MSQYFEEFFICPHCREPLASKDKEKFRKYVGRGPRCCYRCGKEIASALREALAEMAEAVGGGKDGRVI